MMKKTLAFVVFIIATLSFAASALADSSFDEAICSREANIVQKAYLLGQEGYDLNGFNSLMYSSGIDLDHETFMNVAEMFSSIDHIKSADDAYKSGKERCLSRRAGARIRHSDY